MNRGGTERDLDAALADADPMPEHLAASLVPPAVEDLVIGEIIASRQRSFVGRLISRLRGRPGPWRRWSVPALLDPWRAPLPRRIGFVAALLVVAVGLATLYGANGQEATGPATAGPDPDGQAAIAGDSAGTTASTVLSVTGSTVPGQPTDESEQSGSVASQPTPSQPGVDGATGSSSGAVVSDSDSDSGLCVAIEAEDLSMADTAGGWVVGSDPAASGGAFLAWAGPPIAAGDPDPSTVITTTLELAEPGSYRFTWSSRAGSSSGAGGRPATKVAVRGVARFGPTSGGAYGGFVDVAGSGSPELSWAATARVDGIDSDPAIEIAAPGRYALELAPSTPGHEIDRLIIYHQSVDLSVAISGRCD